MKANFDKLYDYILEKGECSKDVLPELYVCELLNYRVVAYCTHLNQCIEVSHAGKLVGFYEKIGGNYKSQGSVTCLEDLVASV